MRCMLIREWVSQTLILLKVCSSLWQALLCVDGVALAPHRQVDVNALDVDFYVGDTLLFQGLRF